MDIDAHLRDILNGSEKDVAEDGLHICDNVVVIYVSAPTDERGAARAFMGRLFRRLLRRRR